MHINIYKYLQFAFNPYSFKEYRNNTNIKDELKHLEYWKNLTFEEKVNHIIENYDKNGPYRKSLILDLSIEEDKKLFQTTYGIIKEKEVLKLEDKKKKDVENIQKRIEQLENEKNKIENDDNYGYRTLNEMDIYTNNLFDKFKGQ
jgi:hypothetical protein